LGEAVLVTDRSAVGTEVLVTVVSTVSALFEGVGSGVVDVTLTEFVMDPGDEGAVT
jgi:hypothetical protein